VGLLFLGAMLAIIIIGKDAIVTGSRSVTGALSPTVSNITQIGTELFTTYVFALEITAALLTIAVVGAVVLSRRPRDLQPIPEPESMTDMGDEPLTAIPEEGAH
jgi:NADH:ubiquinone oxidoreductase subunit 6 (subunit J)